MSLKKISKDQPDSFEFNSKSLEAAKKVISNYPNGKQQSAVMALLYIAQRQNDNWIPLSAMKYIAKMLEMPYIKVYEVATFYTMFHLDPTGKYVLEVCRTGPCMLVGSDKIIEHIEKKLNISVGQTSEDGMFTLKTAECLGACGYGPMLQCSYKNYEHLTIEKVDELLDAMRTNSLEKQ